MIANQKSKIDASSDEGEKPQSVIGDIEFDNVTFTYPARQESPVRLSFSLSLDTCPYLADSQQLIDENPIGKNSRLGWSVRVRQ